MNVELDKSGLISLVRGTEPYYSIFEHPLVKKCGNWNGGLADKWSWNGNLEILSEEELFEVYNLCKESWK